jgi:hypothetical protein
VPCAVLELWVVPWSVVPWSVVPWSVVPWSVVPWSVVPWSARLTRERSLPWWWRLCRRRYCSRKQQ